MMIMIMKTFFDKKRTYLCDDIKDKNTCKYLFMEIKCQFSNNEGNNLFVNKNAMILMIFVT